LSLLFSVQNEFFGTRKSLVSAIKCLADCTLGSASLCQLSIEGVPIRSEKIEVQNAVFITDNNVSNIKKTHNTHPLTVNP